MTLARQRYIADTVRHARAFNRAAIRHRIAGDAYLAAMATRRRDRCIAQARRAKAGAK